MVPERKPRQLHLEVAHPGGMAGAWPDRYKHEEELGPSIVEDLEAGLARLHHKIKGPKLQGQDADHWWQEFLTDKGYTQGYRAERLKEKFRLMKIRVGDAGLWDIVKKQGITYEEAETISTILREVYDPPIRDPDSSEGFTIYPSVASYLRDQKV